MKHTKLEFLVNDKSEAQQDWPKYRIDTPCGMTVAEVFGDANQDLGRLLAAAPELLEACKKAKAHLEAFELSGEGNPCLAIDFLCRAIAKAEGNK